MSDKSNQSPADVLFSEGMKYDLSQDKSPASATLARAAFNQAATMGHTKALRALALMIYDGKGGGEDKEQAILMLWSAFLKQDTEALDELNEILESYSETLQESNEKRYAANAAKQVEELNSCLSAISGFMHTIARQRAGRNIPK